VIRIAPGFGGVNLEDLSAPRCFEVERRVIDALDIPVMHDHQPGTAVVVLAGLINAYKVVGKKMEKSKIVISGAGAAGHAIAKLLQLAGASDITVLDSKGIIGPWRTDLAPHKKELAMMTASHKSEGGLRDALAGADVLIGVSGPGLAKAP